MFPCAHHFILPYTATDFFLFFVFGNLADTKNIELLTFRSVTVLICSIDLI